MTTNAALIAIHEGTGDKPYWAIVSDHEQRPDLGSMRKYGSVASTEKPLQWKFKTAKGTWQFVMLVAKITHLMAGMWLLEGTVDGEAANIVWSVVSRQGTLRFGAYDPAV